MRLHNKVAVVTGGASGLGQSAAVRLAAEGACVVVADRNLAAGRATVQSITAQGGAGLFVECDVAQSTSVAALMQAAVTAYGGLDVLFSCAAIQLFDQDTRAHELDEDVWDRIMSVNLRGLWLCAKHAIPHLQARGGGSIIHAASPTGLTGCAPDQTAYSVSKGGVAALTRTLAAAYAAHNIRVNAVVPGPMETPLTAAYLAQPGVRERLAATTMLGRVGRADETAGLVAFLASDEASYCTGGFFMADGGQCSL